MIEITLLGTGSPIPDPNRAGPSTLVRADGQLFLVDCGRGVLQRAAAIDVGANGLTALLLTHLHSDHIADLGDVLITRWVTTFGPDPAALPIIGPPGTSDVVEATLTAFGHDIGYRLAHHADLTAPPAVEVGEHTEGVVWDRGGVAIRVAPTDHRPVAPTIGFRIESGALRLFWPATPCRATAWMSWPAMQMRWCTPCFVKTSSSCCRSSGSRTFAITTRRFRRPPRPPPVPGSAR